MSIFNSVRGFFGLAPKDPIDGDQSSPRPTGKTAKPVTFNSAMTVSTFFACIRLLAETIASLPIDLYHVDKDGKRGDKADLEIIGLLKYKPNSFQNKIEFFEQLLLNLFSSGNAYARIVRIGDKNSRIVALMPINTASMVKKLKNGEITYRHHITASVHKDYAEHEIWHIRLFGTGLVGLSILEHACKSIAVADAADDKVASLMRNGAKPSGTLMTKGNPTADQRDALRSELSGLINGEQTEIPVLPLDMKFQAISMTPNDIELMATRRFSSEEIARFCGVPSILINDSSHSTNWGSGISAIVEGFHKFTIRPHLERIELSALTNLLQPGEWTKYEFVINADAILRPNRKDRVEMHAKEISSGQRTPNEVRLEEGQSEQKGGDQLYMQINMGTLENISSGNVSVIDQKDTSNA